MEANGLKVTVHQMPWKASKFNQAKKSLVQSVYGNGYNGDVDPLADASVVANDPVLTVDINTFLLSLKSQSIEISNVLLPAADPAVVLTVDASVVDKVQKQVPASLANMVRVIPGKKTERLVAPGPWAGGSSSFSGRVFTENVVRGGKTIKTVTTGGITSGCTTSAVVRDQYGVDFVTSAGHCFPAGSTTTNTVGGAQVNLVVSCYTSSNPSCSPYTYGGVDAAALWSAGSATMSGSVVEQSGSSIGSAQGYSDVYMQSGSWDLEPGVIGCVEGASPIKFSTDNTNTYNAATVCGVGVGWTGDGFYYMTMPPNQALCYGDSGSYIRRATSSGTYNAGILTGVLTELPFGLCYNRTGLNSPYIYAAFTTFYKFHVWFYGATQRDAWPKTW